jgi:uncharacterized protein (DUF1501 family)
MKPAAQFSRRHFVHTLLAAGATAPWSTLSLAGSGQPHSNRFVLVILRGGMDGLSAVPALGDPEFAAARGPLANYSAFASAPLRLDDTFALHPNLTQIHAMFRSGELVVVHAVGLAYRERSHFDAQQLLESGGVKPYEITTGWLGRALAASGERGIAIKTAVPLVLRGPGETDTWAPSSMPDPSPDLLMRLEQLYANDAALARALARAKGLRSDAAGSAGMTSAPMDGGSRALVSGLARKAGEFLAQPRGPQAAVLEMGGWDTHANQNNANGALANNLRNLDAGLAALRESLGTTWSRTIVVVASEFGREVAINGTQGTDHGTGGVAFVLGGALKGARVLADWPGLAKRDRFEGRDLRTTTDLRALLKGVLGDHLRVSSAALDRDVFPRSDGVKPLRVLA